MLAINYTERVIIIIIYLKQNEEEEEEGGGGGGNKFCMLFYKKDKLLSVTFLPIERGKKEGIKVSIKVKFRLIL